MSSARCRRALQDDRPARQGPGGISRGDAEDVASRHFGRQPDRDAVPRDSGGIFAIGLFFSPGHAPCPTRTLSSWPTSPTRPVSRCSTAHSGWGSPAFREAIRLDPEVRAPVFESRGVVFRAQPFRRGEAGASAGRGPSSRPPCYPKADVPAGACRRRRQNDGARAGVVGWCPRDECGVRLAGACLRLRRTRERRRTSNSGAGSRCRCRGTSPKWPPS